MGSPRQLGRYRVEGVLGSGGMGVVYAARSPEGRAVALKSIATHFDADLLARFKREAKLLGQLDHPGLCRALELVESGPGAPFLVLDHVPGETLAALARDGLEVPRAVELMIQVCEAVEHAHQAGVLHRDLKPSNVMITPDDRAVVLDFGLARRSGDAESQALSRTGDVLGTPGFMAPEQALGEEATALGDVYGLGATLFAALTGEPPFRGKSTLDTLLQVTTGKLRSVSELRALVPGALDAVCARALSRQPHERFGSAADLAAALRAVRHDVGGETPRSRGVAVAGLIAVVAVLGLTLGLALALRQPPATVPAAVSPTAEPAALRVAAVADRSAPPVPAVLGRLEFERQYRDWKQRVEVIERKQVGLAVTKQRLLATRRRAVEARATEAVRRWVARRPGDAQAWLASARVAHLFHRSYEAEASARVALDLRPGLARAQVVLAQVLWRRAMWEFLNTWVPTLTKRSWSDEALRRFRAVSAAGVELTPIDRAWCALFRALAATWDKLPAAETEGRRAAFAVAIEPLQGWEATYLDLLLEVSIKGFRSRAFVQKLSAAIDAAPHAVPLRRVRGSILLATQLTLAQGDLRAVLRSRPNAHDLWIVSRSLLSEQRTAALTTLLEEVAPELNEPSLVALIRAHLALGKREFPLALAEAERAGHSGVRSSLRNWRRVIEAQARLELGEYAAAGQLLEDAGGSPRGTHQGPRALTGARCLLALGRPGKALTMLETYHQSGHRDARSYMLRGFAATGAQRHDEAIQMHRQALRRSRDRSLALAMLGVAQASADRLHEAEQTLVTLTQSDPRSVHRHTLAGFVAMKKRQLAEAERLLTSAIKAPGQPHERALAFRLRGQVRRVRGDVRAVDDLVASLDCDRAQPIADQLRQMIPTWRAERKQ